MKTPVISNTIVIDISEHKHMLDYLKYIDESIAIIESKEHDKDLNTVRTTLYNTKCLILDSVIRDININKIIYDRYLNNNDNSGY